MSNPLKKTMVYLGLADEEEAYEEPAPQPRFEVPASRCRASGCFPVRLLKARAQ